MGTKLREPSPPQTVQATIIASDEAAAQELRETFRGMATFEIQQQTHDGVLMVVTAADQLLMESIRNKADGRPLINGNEHHRGMQSRWAHSQSSVILGPAGV
ncbi:MAG: hypothetical protein PHW10_02850 [Candidatus Peribacteraceae bacterium]|nr:hypothetical protein [Candidatus Peribacteraceae bacterium]